MNEAHRINVLHFSCEPVRAGVEEHMLMLLRKLDRSLFRLHLVCPAELLKKFGNDIPDDVARTPLMLESVTHAAAAWRFAKLLRRDHIEIVHAHTFRASLAVSAIARLCGVPVTIETDHVREHWRKGWIKSNFFVDRVMGRFVSQYIAVSQSTGDYLTSEKRLPAGKVTVIANGCDINRFHPDYQAHPELARKFELDPASRIIAVLARLEPQKGHRVLLDALPAVVREFPNLQVIFAGDGQLRQELEEHTHRLGLDSQVHFVGYQSNVQDWLAMAEFTVLPSFYEGLPLTAIESLAAGRTVVATAVDGTTEVVVDQRTGLTVKPGDSVALAAAILRLLKSPELRQQLATAGRQWVVDHFSQERQVRQTEHVYLDALRRRRPVTLSSNLECTDHGSL